MTLKVFNIEKVLHHFLETVKCFNFEKWLHRILMSLKVFQDPLLKVTYHIILMINGLHLLWFPMFIALEIYSFFGTKFSWNEGTGTCVNFVCVLVDRNFDFLGGYCLLPSGYYWLLLVTWCLLLVTGGYCSLPLVTARYHFWYERVPFYILGTWINMRDKSFIKTLVNVTETKID